MKTTALSVSMAGPAAFPAESGRWRAAAGCRRHAQVRCAWVGEELQRSHGLLYSATGSSALLKTDRRISPEAKICWFIRLHTPRPQKKQITAMGSEMVMVEGIAFPLEIAAAKPIALLGHGITDIEIHFLQIKFTAIGVYLDRGEVVKHLQKWKGKKGDELKEDDAFFEALISAPVDKLLRIVVIKEIKGSQYGTQLESAVRDRLAAVDKYEEEEEEALEKITEFLQSKYFMKDSVLTMSFPAASSRTAQIAFAAEGKEEAKIRVENANVAEMLQRWYLGGTTAISPTTVASLAENLGQLLSEDEPSGVAS